MGKNVDAEQEFREMAKHHSWWTHKWGDVRICEDCHKKLVFQPRAEEEDHRDPRATIVDYLSWVTTGMWIWTECKGQRDQVRFDFSEIQPNQRQFLNDWSNRDEYAFLFILMGFGNPAKFGGRMAFYIPWDTYELAEQQYAVRTDRASWTLTDFTVTFAPWRLAWDKGWRITKDHAFAQKEPSILTCPKLFQVEMK